MLDNNNTGLDLLRISVPGPIKVDILGSKTMEFEAPDLRLSGADTLSPEQLNILQVMIKLISQMEFE